MSQLPPIKKMKISDSNSSHQLDVKSLNLFSRQNAALGAETTAKLIKMKVIIYGLRGVGMETAKNLALQGVGAITLVDTNVIEEKDIGVNFFLQKADVGKLRANVVVPRLRELNLVCQVSAADKIDESILIGHNALVVTQVLPLSQLIQLNNLCRVHKLSFFYVFTSGVSTDIFVDHGVEHIINDPNGDKPVQKLITDIQINNERRECLIRYETPEGEQPIALTNGFIDISEVKGIVGINGHYNIIREPNDPVKTIRISFESSNTTVDKYISGGIITEKKVPFDYPMDTFEAKLKNPGNPFAEPPTMVLTDLINFGSEIQQHVAYYAVLKFFSDKNKLPNVFSDVDSENVLEIAKSLLANKEIELDEGFEIDTKLLLRYAKYSSVELQSLAAFTGGVLAQEVVKCTGKFTPIPGFMHFSAWEALPDEVPSIVDTLPKGLQYDELASIYGWKFVEKLGSLKYFMVGCGALGCEFMKNFALNGICCGPNGKLIVTDADRIELSNLSRQFLFREHNVGHAKSKAASIMAKVMNPDFNVEALELFVGPKSEDFFNDDFWESLDGVCNALDNMEARLYVDQSCVKYEKSLLESGTMGTSGNIDTICPFKTKTYKDGGNAAEGGGVPMCTLRNFPHLTDHCIEWARDQFELLFSKISKTFEAYIIDPFNFEEKIKSKAESEPGSAYFDIRSITSFAKLVSNPSIFNAAQLSFDLFHFLFRDKILDLQHAFPIHTRMIDEKTGQDKGPFWGEKKRYPTVAVFDTNDESHTSFMLSATCLFSVIVGLIPPKDENDENWLKEYRSTEWIVNIVSTLTPPTYIQAPVNSEGIENAPKVDKQLLHNIVENLLLDLRNVTTSYLNQKSSNNGALLKSFETIEFEKDDDNNFHIAFITATANLRCDNYTIKRTDFHACKVIAGKIIAAIATTTAAVCGLVILELFKLVLNKDTEAFMNRAIGLAQFSYTSFTQEKPREFSSSVVYKQPDPTIPLTNDAYDESGKVKTEFLKKIVSRAYPEKHSVWNKLVVNGSLTLKEFSRWLEVEHNLALLSWNFIYGHNNVYDEETKKKRLQAVSTQVYPQKLRIDFSLLPSLDLDVGQATRAIMKTGAAKPTQQYINLWKEFKVAGSIPPPPPLADEDEVITEQSTLKEILEKMSKLAEKAELSKKIETRAIPSLKGRKFFVIPGSEAPLCRDIDTDETIDDLCSLKIIL